MSEQDGELFIPAGPSCIVFRFTCRTCGGDVDEHDERWFPQCGRCEHAERRKRGDELFRKVLAEIVDDDLTITVDLSRAYQDQSYRPNPNT